MLHRDPQPSEVCRAHWRLQPPPLYGRACTGPCRPSPPSAAAVATRHGRAFAREQTVPPAPRHAFFVFVKSMSADAGLKFIW